MRCAALLAAIALVCASSSVPSGAQSQRSAFFSVKQEQGAWWLVDPEGRRFFSNGVNEVSAGGDPSTLDPAAPEYFGLRFFPNHAAWWRSTSARLREWGFNTAGGWPDERVVATREIPYVVSLQLGKMVGAPWADVGTPESLAIIRPIVERAGIHKDERLLIGYFIDNELDWYDDEVFTFWGRPASTNRIKAEWWALVQAAYGRDLRSFLNDFDVTPVPGSFDALKDALKLIVIRPGRRPQIVSTFAEWFAGDYYRVMTAEVKRVDPNHLILGDRYANNYSQAVVRAAARYLDVVSVNYDVFEPSGWMSPFFFDTLSRISGKPLLVTEFYVAAMENRSGNLNRNGPFVTVQSQRERASLARTVVEQMARMPSIVGYHWFRWADEPPGGRFKDGEDFNMGLVDLNDRPYEELTSALATVNRDVLALHARGPAPKGIRTSAGVWHVPAAVASRTEDWANAKLFGPAYWVREVNAPAPWMSFADFYVAWQPDGVFFGASYQDHFRGGGDGSTLPDRQKLILTVSSEGGAPQQFVVVGMGESDANGHLVPLSLYPATGSSLSPTRAITGTQRADSGMDQAIELFVPASILGLERLTAGTRIRIGASLVMRGDGKETFWPASQVADPPSASRMATLRLANP